MKELLLLCFMYFNVLAAMAQQPYVVVLGVAQDGGYPQAGCRKSCCRRAWEHADQRRLVSSLALVDPAQNSAWLFDATPDFKEQWQWLVQHTNDSVKLAGIFLTHAHTGHYTGLMNLGREMMGTKQIPVYAMPRMKQFIETNGPWSLLVKLQNIRLEPLQDSQAVVLGNRLSVVPVTVPHRDEFSETVGFRICDGAAQVLFIPDIDKWEKWNRNIVDEVKRSRYAFVDATFMDEAEVAHRNIREIPHPLVSETMQLFARETAADRARIRFIHFNHSNALLDDHAPAVKQLERQGFHTARQGMEYFFAP